MAMCWFSVVVTLLGRSTKLLYTRPGLVSTWMGNHLRVGKPSWHYVTATKVISAFYPPWDGKMSISFRAE